MIVEFSITNYRSIHKTQTFTMLASGARSKAYNTFDITLENGSTLKLINSAGIFGANASGKSNIIRAFFEIRSFIINYKDIDISMSIPAYDPFLFNTASTDQPTVFEIIFLTKQKKKYHYKLSFIKNQIINESLYHFPKKKAQLIFNRGSETKEVDINIHVIKLGKNFGFKKFEIHKKIPLLSIFGKADNYHTTISPAYTYFEELEVWNVTDSSWIRRLGDKMKQELQSSENEELIKQVEMLISNADIQIQSLIIDAEKSHDESDTNATDKKTIRSRFQKREVLFGEHHVYKENKVISSHALPFSNESFGTNKLFALGALIVRMLNQGGVVIFDELDSSLHPILTSLLVSFFQKSNQSNSQLIFTTHETFLLKNDFRTDQIWFTQKNDYGETELFSAQDFEEVRESIPFEKWYLGGKFGAIPYLNDLIETISDGKKEDR